MAENKKPKDEAVNNDHAGVTQEFYDKKAEQSAENKRKGGSDVEVSLVDTHKVRFTKDFGFMKKGAEATVSDVAYQIYNGKGVVEKIN